MKREVNRMVVYGSENFTKRVVRDCGVEAVIKRKSLDKQCHSSIEFITYTRKGNYAL